MKVNIFLSLCFLAGYFSNVQAQNHSEIEAIARQIIKEAPVCNLLTIDAQKRPVARAMDAQLPREGFVVWMATNPRSRKVSQIKKNPKVSLYYLSSDGYSYVLLKGKAMLKNSEKLKKSLMTEQWAPFYPSFKDLLLIKFKPETLEIVSTKHGLQSDENNWKPVTIKL